MSSPSPYLTWSKGHNKRARAFTKGCQGSDVNHTLTTALPSLSSTIILHCSFISHHPSILLLASHLLHQILIFSSTTCPPFSPCVQTTSTHTALLDEPTLVTPVLLCISSFLTQSIRVIPHILLRNLISISFNHFSATAIPYASSPYSAVGTANPSYKLLFTFIPLLYN